MVWCVMVCDGVVCDDGRRETYVMGRMEAYVQR